LEGSDGTNGGVRRRLRPSYTFTTCTEVVVSAVPRSRLNSRDDLQASVRHKHAVASRKWADEMTPAPPVLGPAMQQDERRSLPGLGDVDLHVAELDKPVGDPADSGSR
jgi:hypothetical protein